LRAGIGSGIDASFGVVSIRSTIGDGEGDGDVHVHVHVHVNVASHRDSYI
jgi:hypothetical protein